MNLKALLATTTLAALTGCTTMVVPPTGYIQQQQTQPKAQNYYCACVPVVEEKRTGFYNPLVGEKPVTYQKPKAQGNAPAAKQPAKPQAKVQTTPPKTKKVNGETLTFIGYGNNGQPIYVNNVVKAPTTVKKPTTQNKPTPKVKPAMVNNQPRKPAPIAPNANKKQSVEDAIKQAQNAATPPRRG